MVKVKPEPEPLANTKRRLTDLIAVLKKRTPTPAILARIAKKDAELKELK